MGSKRADAARDRDVHGSAEAEEKEGTQGQFDIS
jgi:hypothetical protein